MTNWRPEAILGSLVSFMVTEGIFSPFPLFRLLYDECSGAAAFFPFFFFFFYFSSEAGEGRTGSENNTWLMINCKLQLNSINPSNPQSLGPESMSEDGFLLDTFQNNHIPLFSAFLGRAL